MSGGDAPPPNNGGEFLLQLLRKPSQQSNLQQQTFSHDPAIAAVGPSAPTYPPFYHSNNHNIINNNNNLPYNYFPPNPILNPVNNPGSDLVFGNFTQSIAKDSIFTGPRVNLARGNVENRQSNQIVAKDSIFSGPRVNLGRGSVENRQNGNNRIPPPGFTSKIGEGSNGNGRRVIDHNVGKGKVVIANNRVESGDVIKGMLDLRVSDSVVRGKGFEEVKDIEFCDVDYLMSLLPPPKDESSEKKKEDLGVEDEGGEKSDKKKNHRRRVCYCIRFYLYVY